MNQNAVMKLSALLSDVYLKLCNYVDFMKGRKLDSYRGILNRVDNGKTFIIIMHTGYTTTNSPGFCVLKRIQCMARLLYRVKV